MNIHTGDDARWKSEAGQRVSAYIAEHAALIHKIGELAKGQDVVIVTGELDAIQRALGPDIEPHLRKTRAAKLTHATIAVTTPSLLTELLRQGNVDLAGEVLVTHEDLTEGFTVLVCLGVDASCCKVVPFDVPKGPTR